TLAAVRVLCPVALLYGRIATAAYTGGEENRNDKKNSLSQGRWRGSALTGNLMVVTMSDCTPAPLSLCLFGPFEARVNGVPLARLRSRKGYWLLALLTLRNGTEVERSWVAGTLWPDSPQ